MSVKIEPCESARHPGWLMLRQALWPHVSHDQHFSEMAMFVAQPGRYRQFVAYSLDQKTIGFAEASLRTDYVNGTETSPVAFLEGIYVVPEARRQGVAAALVTAVAQWAETIGCKELASDALIENTESHAMHCALGFEETERVVYFRKLLSQL